MAPFYRNMVHALFYIHAKKVVNVMVDYIIAE